MIADEGGKVVRARCPSGEALRMLEAGGGGLVEEATGNLPGKPVGMEELVDDNKRLQVKIGECGLVVALLPNM